MEGVDYQALLRGCPKSFVSWGRFANRPYNV